MLLDIESEFELMVTYQITLESKSTLVEHSLKDQYRFGLYKIAEPYPTYEEYITGHDFTEGELIEECSDIVPLQQLQESRRK